MREGGEGTITAVREGKDEWLMDVVCRNAVCDAC